MESPLQFFAGITDPRVERTKDHFLDDIIFITIAGVICGAETWNEIHDFGKSKQDWLSAYLKLPNGIPSHDTFNRVYSMLDPKEFGACFMQWTNSVATLTEGEVLSIDGKTLRGTMKHGKKSFVHMVSAWASTNNLVLAQQKVDDKSNEITAIPKLLELLAIKGCIITIDAMGCQKEIAANIIDKEADYILAVKDNQATLHADIKDSFRMLKPDCITTENDYGHGRIEKRECSVITDLSLLEQRDQWTKLTTIIQLKSERQNKQTLETQYETRYYISSLKADATKMNKAIRSHWNIENKLHWQLDVSFREDQSRKQNGNAAENFSLMLRIALNLLKNDMTSKRSVKGKRLKAGWDEAYLKHLLKI